MGWCPSCKNEFVEGITICPKCDVQLVNSLDEANEKGKVQEKELIEQGKQAWQRLLNCELRPDKSFLEYQLYQLWSCSSGLSF